MNKQKLLKKVDDEKYLYPEMKQEYIEDPSVEYKKGYNAASEQISRLIEQLDEPQKVKVPAFVAEWYEEHKYNLDNSIWAYASSITQFHSRDLKLNDFEKWFSDFNNEPIETLIRMKYGYEVEEEPLYTVTINLDRKYHLVVDEGDGDDEISTTLTTRHGVLGYRYFLTEKEIKAIDERYWQFAEPVEQVEV